VQYSGINEPIHWLIETRRNLAELVPDSVARACSVLPQPSRGRVLKVLSSDPLDFEAIDAVRFYYGRPIEMALATHQAIQESIDRVYVTSDS
jgi:type IV pilus assembly protein PilB